MKMNLNFKIPTIDKGEKFLKNKKYRKSLGNIGVADIKRNFLTRGGNIGRVWPPLKKRIGKRLRDTGQLIGSIHATQQTSSVNIIATRSTKDKKGKANIAWIQHHGCRIHVTPKMRAYLHYKGIHLKKTTHEIVVPPSPFMELSPKAIDEMTEFIKDGLT